MKNEGWLDRLFLPPEEPPSLPYSRFCKIALRTAHLMAISVLGRRPCLRRAHPRAAAVALRGHRHRRGHDFLRGVPQHGFRLPGLGPDAIRSSSRCSAASPSPGRRASPSCSWWWPLPPSARTCRESYAITRCCTNGSSNKPGNAGCGLTFGPTPGLIPSSRQWPGRPETWRA